MDENIPSEASAEHPVSDSVSDPVLSSNAPTVATRIRHILELIRFSHTIFALPFALLAAALAWFQPDSVFRWQDLLGILLCMVFARSAAMAFNRLVDRDVDAANPRTEKRHIPAGLLSAKLVALFTFVCSAAFVASTLIFLPKRLPIRRAPISCRW